MLKYHTLLLTTGTKTQFVQAVIWYRCVRYKSCQGHCTTLGHLFVSKVSDFICLELILCSMWYALERILFEKRIRLPIAQLKIWLQNTYMNGKDNMYLPVCDISDTTYNRAVTRRNSHGTTTPIMANPAIIGACTYKKVIYFVL